MPGKSLMRLIRPPAGLLIGPLLMALTVPDPIPDPLPGSVADHLPKQVQQAGATPRQSGNPVLIAAAADLQYAMDSLIGEYRSIDPDANIRVTYGSSGNFFAQITHAAPFDLFFSADMDYPGKLAEKGLSPGPVTPYAIGQIVVWSKKIDPAKLGIRTLLDPSIVNIAIANPDHAPYGMRARESLIYYKIFDQVRDKLVLGENISQTAQFAASGSADIGIIALSLARSPAMQKEGGKYWLIPAGSHAPLRQGYILLDHARGNGTAQRFAEFIGSPNAIAIFEYFGFSRTPAAN